FGALVKLPVSWAAVPIAAMALAFERLHLSRTQLVDTVVGPLSRMTMVVAALAGAALAIPIAASAPFERAALPVEIVLLTGYYMLRASRGAAWEQRLATAGPGLAVVATVYSAGADLAVVALASVVVGSAYVAHELASSIDHGLGSLAPLVEPVLRSPMQARIAAALAELLSAFVSVGSFPDARVHTVVNALYAVAGAGVGVRIASRRTVWIAAAAAMLCAYGAYRWSGLPPVFAPVFALVPAVSAFATGYLPQARSTRMTFLQIATAASVMAAGIG